MIARVLSSLLVLVASAVWVTGAPAQSDRLGEIDFVTSAEGEAQEVFTRGVLYLHSFEYDDAGDAFRRAQELDPEFAMAYWGEALSHDHPLWGEEDLDEARAVLKRLGPTPEARRAKAPTRREKAYLAAVEALFFGPGDKAERDRAYAEAMGRVREAYPEDREAAALYALSLLGSVEGRDVSTYMRAAAVAEEVFADDPDHPGALHYLIHAYDDPDHAPLGLRAARAYARIAPDAPHALHMPSHIFMALGRWDDVRLANERAWHVSIERMERKGLGPGARNYHSLFWLHYANLQLGRTGEARGLLEVAREAAAESPDGGARWHLARMRAHHIAHGPEGAAALVEPALETTGVGTSTALANLLAVAAHATETGRADLVREAASRARETGPLDDDEAIALLEIEALERLADGDAGRALETLRSAADRHASLPFVFGPPTPAVRPPAELLGEVLLTLDRPAEAEAAFRRSLARYPGRARSASGLRRAETARGSAAADTLVVADVHVVPMSGDTVLADLAVRIVDGTIAWVGPTGELVAAPGAAVVDGRGRYLVPGLVDAHVHLRDESELLSYLAHGVTTVVNLRGSPAHLALRDSIADGEVVGPTIYTAGPTIDGDPPIWDSSGTDVAATPAEARSIVADHAEAGYDLIKTYNNLLPDALRAAVDEAHAHGLAVVGHLPRKPDRTRGLEVALDAGMAMIPHGEEIFFTHLGGGGDDASPDEMEPVDPARIREAARRIAEAGAAVTPNLSFIEMTARMLDDIDPVFEGHREWEHLSPGVQEMWREYNPTRRDNLEGFAAREAIKAPAVRALTAELQRLGVPLLVGTDAAIPGLYPGWSTLLELEELVAAGLTPYEALVAGTRAPGAWLADHVPGARPIGTIEPGRIADLVVVESNPLEDVSALGEVAGVIVRGRWLPVEELERLRESDR